MPRLSAVRRETRRAAGTSVTTAAVSLVRPMRNAVVGALVLAGALAAGCSGSDGDAGAPATKAPSRSSEQSAGESGSALSSELRPPITIRNFGIGLAVPEGWAGRMFLTFHGDLPQVHVASFPLPANDAQLEFGKAASRMMGANDVRIRVMELPTSQVGTQGFNPTRLPIRIRRSDIKPLPSWVPREHAHAGRRFAVHRRPFSLSVEFGRKPPTARQLEQANRVVSSLEIDPRPELDPTQWRPLRRPLKLPRISADAVCPRSSSELAVPRVSYPLGPGPVYPGIGSADGVASLKDDLVRRGWYLHKTLWAISPRYRGPVLIRGARIDGAGVLRFNFRLTREFKLHKLPSKARSRWRYVPSHTALRGPGCFALQVDGSSFNRTIVFQATGA